MTRLTICLMCVGLITLVAGCDPSMDTGGNENDNAANENDNATNENDNAGMAGEEMSFVATLTPDQEVPAVESAGTGAGSFTLSADQSTLTLNISASGLSGPVTGSHIHLGAPGEAGPIVFAFETSETDGAISADAVWEIDADSLAALLAGNLYVNVHTDLNPAGEIRGLLTLDGS